MIGGRTSTGVGGDVTYLKIRDRREILHTVGRRYRRPHPLQGGILTEVGSNGIRMLDHFQMGPNLVRGFAPNGIGPRDINPFGTQDALGGTKYWGASLDIADAVLVPAEGSWLEGCRLCRRRRTVWTTRDRQIGP